MLCRNAISLDTALTCDNAKLNGIGTRPGCDAPGYHSVVHHAAQDWKNGGNTDVQDLTLACPPDNELVETGGWDTRKLAGGQTQWIPPPGLPMLKGGVNTYHHPERLLPKDDEKD